MAATSDEVAPAEPNPPSGAPDPPGPRSSRSRATLALLSWILFGALYLTLPPSGDQFNHAYLGWRLLQGDVPYRDFIDMNWPGVMGVHALGSFLFGNHLWSWRALDFILFAASTFFLADLVKREAGRHAGWILWFICPLVYAGLPATVAGQHDMTATQFLLGSLWFHVRGYDRIAWRSHLGTGLFLALAMLNKPTVGVIGLLYPLHALWLRIPFGRIVRHTAVAGAATVGVLVMAASAVLLRGASLREMGEAVYTFNAATQFLGARSFPHLILMLITVHLRWWPVLTLAAIPAFVVLIRKPGRSIVSTALPMLWLTGLISFLIQRRGFGYHLSPCVPALTGGLAVFLSLLRWAPWRIYGASAMRRIAAGIVLFTLLGLGTKLVRVYASLPSALLAGDYGRYLAGIPENDSISIAEALAFTRRLDLLPPGEPVLVVGTASSINYLSRRREPTRFYHFPVLLLSEPPLPMADRWNDLWAQDLRKTGCRFCLLSKQVRSVWLQGGSRGAAELRTFLSHYQSAGFIGGDPGMEIYERN